MGNALVNLLSVVVVLGVIIFVHEAGHLAAAKVFGIRVLTFSLGFGRKILGFRRGETEYRVSAIPLGGYVKLGGEEASEATGDPREFQSRPRWQRIIVYLAGPTMNILLAIALIAIVFMVGIDIPDLQEIPPVVGLVEEGSSGEQAGVLVGDRVVAVNGRAVDRWQDVGFEMMTAPGQPVVLTLERDGARREATVVPQRVERYEFGDTAGVYPQLLPRVVQLVPGAPAEAAGFQVGDELRAVEGRPVTGSSDFVAAIEARPGQHTVVEIERDGRPFSIAVVPADQDGKGKIGLYTGIFQRYGPLEAVVQSARYNLNVVRQTFAVLGKIFTREIAAKSALSGPLEIASLSGQAARTGVKNLLYLMGFISISVAILNLLPLPILDGGQILMLLVESSVRRDLPLGLKERINQVGFFLLVGIMLLVLYFDVSKLWPAQPPSPP
jgi:regulator of sigma E protease